MMMTIGGKIVDELMTAIWRHTSLASEVSQKDLKGAEANVIT